MRVRTSDFKNFHLKYRYCTLGQRFDDLVYLIARKHGHDRSSINLAEVYQNAYEEIVKFGNTHVEEEYKEFDNNVFVCRYNIRTWINSENKVERDKMAAFLTFLADYSSVSNPYVVEYCFDGIYKKNVTLDGHAILQLIQEKELLEDIFIHI